MPEANITALAAAARHNGRTMIDEPTGKRVLRAFGIAVPASREVEPDSDVRAAAAQLTPPFVLKAVCPDIVHKSEFGAVKVGLDDAEALARALHEMAAGLKARGLTPERWLVEEMAPPGVECTIGGMLDPEFGPMVMFGLGGIFIELFADVAFRICPIEPSDAREMIEELRGAAIFRGARGREPVSVDALVEALVAFGGEDGVMMRCRDEISEIDINPLIAGPNGAVAADARFVLSVGVQ